MIGICILDFMYSVNDSDFYMKAITVGGDIIKVKMSKEEFLNWCKSHEDDDQNDEPAYYANFYDRSK